MQRFCNQNCMHFGFDLAFLSSISGTDVVLFIVFFFSLIIVSNTVPKLLCQSSMWLFLQLNALYFLHERKTPQGSIKLSKICRKKAPRSVENLHQNCIESISFQGLCPLGPHQGFGLDPLGASRRPPNPLPL